MKKFYIEAHGCCRRLLDGERINNYLLANGFLRVASPAEARCVIIVTCAVSRKMAEECLTRINSLQRFKEKMIVYGCLPAMFPERLRSIYDGSVLVTKDLQEIDALFPEASVRFHKIGDANWVLDRRVDCLNFKENLKFFFIAWARRIRKAKDYWVREYTSGWPFVELFRKGLLDLSHIRFGLIEGILGGIGFDHSVVAIRVSEGCLGQCSYCGIRKAIGRIKSKPMPEIFEELKRIVAQKRYNLNICSSDLGVYGVDIQSNMIDLIKGILMFDERIHIQFMQDLNPVWVYRYKESFIELVCLKRIHSVLMPVQSGSERILKLMKREFDMGGFKQFLQDIREKNHAIRFKTQVIIGFPTETDEDFQKTVFYLRECGFDQIDVFAYFAVEGTEAAALPDKVPFDVVQARMKSLTRLLPPQTIKFPFGFKVSA